LTQAQRRGESPKTMMVSDVSGLSSASPWGEIATQRSNSTPRNCTEVCIISLPACLPGKSLYGGGAKNLRLGMPNVQNFEANMQYD